MTARSARRDEIQHWIIQHLASELRLDPQTIDVTRPLTFYGLDSLTAAGLVGELEDWVGHPLSLDMFSDRATIASVATFVAAVEPTEIPRIEAEREGASAAVEWSPSERRLRRIIDRFVAITTVLHVEGTEIVPRQGPVIIASNHLHLLDIVWMFAIVPRRVAFLIAEGFGRVPILRSVLAIGQPIYIRRGRSDVQALDRALEVLRGGGAVVIAPEGRLSKTGGLIKGHTGVAYLASQSGAPVVPVGAFGQERAGWHWRRLRKVPVTVRFGQPLRFTAGRAAAHELQSYVDDIMRAIARTLPTAYRGVYAD